MLHPTALKVPPLRGGGLEGNAIGGVRQENPALKSIQCWTRTIYVYSTFVGY